MILIGAANCGGGGAGAGSNNDGGGVAPGTAHLRATIDGKAWASDAISAVVTASAKNPGALVIQGTQVASASNFLGVFLSLGFISGPATYPLGVNAGTTAGGTGQVTDQTGAVWMTDLGGSGGSITLSAVSGGHIAGTFQFTATPGLGSTATTTRMVTDGDFDLKLPAFTMRAADDYGSSLSATLNGQPFNAATVTASGSAASGAFGIASSTSALSLNLTTSMAVSNGSSFDQSQMTFQAVDTKTAQGYGGSGTIASVSITMVSATRVAGTFIATLPPLNGTGTPLIFTDGKFDVRMLAAQ